MALSDAAIILSEKKAVIEIEVKRDSPLYQLTTVTLDKPKSGYYDKSSGMRSQFVAVKFIYEVWTSKETETSCF